MSAPTTEDPSQWNDYVDAVAHALQLPIAPEHRAGVLQNFARLAAMARQVSDAPLDVHDEPAPVFRPGSRE